MQPDEIKQRLACRRPHSDDQELADLAEAWAAAQADPELREWAQSEEAFDAALADAFSEAIEIPAGLRERLLAIEGTAEATAAAPFSADETAAAKATPKEAATGNLSTKTFANQPDTAHATNAPLHTDTAHKNAVPATGGNSVLNTGTTVTAATAAGSRPSSKDSRAVESEHGGIPFFARLANLFRRSPLQRGYGPFATVAACAVAVVAFLLFSDPNAVVADNASELPSFYAEIASHYALQAEASDPADDIEAIRQTLKAKDAPQPNVLAATVVRLKKLGCGVIHWKGRKVSYIPMQAEKEEGLYYLYIISRESMPDPDEAAFEEEITEERLGVLMQSWGGPQNLYILLSPASEAP